MLFLHVRVSTFVQTTHQHEHTMTADVTMPKGTEELLIGHFDSVIETFKGLKRSIKELFKEERRNRTIRLKEEAKKKKNDADATKRKPSKQEQKSKSILKPKNKKKKDVNKQVKVTKSVQVSDSEPAAASHVDLQPEDVDIPGLDIGAF